MGKHAKFILVLFLAQAFLIVPPLFARAVSDTDYMLNMDKIYQRIDTITFSFSGSTINYAVIMGSHFDNLNATHVRLHLDVLIKTTDDNFITNMRVTCSGLANFTVKNAVYQTSGEGSDSTGFSQYGELLYSYEVCYVDVPSADLFPVTVGIAFNYTLASDSGEFVKTNKVTVSGFFLGPTIWSFIVVGIVVLISLAIVFIVRAVKRRHAEGGSYKSSIKSHKTSYKYKSSVSSKDIREYEKQRQAELKAEAEAEARAEAEAKARAAAAREKPLSSPGQVGVPSNLIGITGTQTSPAPISTSGTSLSLIHI